MIKPEMSEITDYMAEKGWTDPGEPEAFYDYFESNGWMVGKHRMKCWKAAVRNWIRNAKKWSKKHEAHKPSFAEQQRADAQRAMQELEMEPRNGKASLRLVR